MITGTSLTTTDPPSCSAMKGGDDGWSGEMSGAVARQVRPVIEATLDRSAQRQGACAPQQGRGAPDDLQIDAACISTTLFMQKYYLKLSAEGHKIAVG